MKTNISIIICCIIGLMAMSCRTQKTGTTDVNVTQTYTSDFSPEQYFKKVNDHASREKWFSAKIKCTVKMGDEDISTSGQLRMKKDEVIQIILMDPVAGLLELGRLEFTTTNLKMLDRFNKNYIDVPYAEVEFLNKCDIDFNSLQNLFWNRLFIPSKPNLTAKDFNYTNQQGGEPSYSSNIVMKFVDDMLTYEFITDPSKAALTKTVIYGTRDKDAQFAFTYSDFKTFEGKPFPHDMCMSFIMGKQNASIQFSANSVKNKSGWETNTRIPSRYNKMTPEELFKKLMGK